MMGAYSDGYYTEKCILWLENTNHTDKLLCFGYEWLGMGCWDAKKTPACGRG